MQKWRKVIFLNWIDAHPFPFNWPCEPKINSLILHSNRHLVSKSILQSFFMYRHCLAGHFLFPLIYFWTTTFSWSLICCTSSFPLTVKSNDQSMRWSLAVNKSVPSLFQNNNGQFVLSVYFIFICDCIDFERIDCLDCISFFIFGAKKPSKQSVLKSFFCSEPFFRQWQHEDRKRCALLSIPLFVIKTSNTMNSSIQLCHLYDLLITIVLLHVVIVQKCFFNNVIDWIIFPTWAETKWISG